MLGSAGPARPKQWGLGKKPGKTRIPGDRGDRAVTTQRRNTGTLEPSRWPRACAGTADPSTGPPARYGGIHPTQPQTPRQTPAAAPQTTDATTRTARQQRTRTTT